MEDAPEIAPEVAEDAAGGRAPAPASTPVPAADARKTACSVIIMARYANCLTRSMGLMISVSRTPNFSLITTASPLATSLPFT